MTEATHPPAALPRRDRAIILGALAGLTAICWWYSWLQTAGMDEMAAMPARFAPWTGTDVALNILIWWVMMIGMMVPGVAPMVLVVAAVNRGKRERGEKWVPTVLFTAGYLIVWGLFGIAATAADWGLEQAALISPQTQSVGPFLGGAIIIAAGLYQLTPVKYACLAKCRSPLAFLLTRWRDGGAGALVMGAEHGLFCLGCCWVLMLLLFAGGVMSLVWMAALAALVLIEKIAPGGAWIARGSGALLLVFGAYLLLKA